MHLPDELVLFEEIAKIIFVGIVGDCPPHVAEAQPQVVHCAEKVGEITAGFHVLGMESLPV